MKAEVAKLKFMLRKRSANKTKKYFSMSKDNFQIAAAIIFSLFASTLALIITSPFIKVKSLKLRMVYTNGMLSTCLLLSWQMKKIVVRLGLNFSNLQWWANIRTLATLQ